MKTITALCKGGPLHSGTFTFRDLYIPGSLYTGTFTFRDLYIPGPLHSGTFTYRDLYIPGPLHSGTFTYRDLYIPGPLHTVTDLDYFKYLDFLNINSNLFFRLLMELRHYKMSTLFYL
jgi:hypothetical protein